MAHQPSDAFTELNAGCACGQLKVSVQVPTTSLPLTVQICHCDTCRHISGHLCITDIALPDGYQSFQVHGTPTRYATSKGLIRCFCSTCGASVYEDSPDPKRVGICAGALTTADGVIQGFENIFVADTKDGGLREWLPNAPAWEGQPNGASKEIPPETSFQSTASQPAAIKSDDKLHASCHCGGVQYTITRPNEQSYNLSSPWGDAFKPHHEGPGKENKEDVKWWIRANGTKYAASLCPCISCRQASGYDLQPWAFVPRFNIHPDDGSPFGYDFGTLKQYSMTPGCYRNFCSTCGAKVFWHCDERPDLVDIGVGLLEANGTRAEEWLEWGLDRISFKEFAQNKPLVADLQVGMNKWRDR